LSWLVFVVCWTVCISLSRVYLGAHSFQDIVIGGIIGVPFGILSFSLLEIYHEKLVMEPFWIILFVMGIFVLFMHTHPIDKSSRLNFHLSEGTFDYTSPLLGLTLGGLLFRPWHVSTQEQCIASLNPSLLIRWVIGASVSIFSYIYIKKILPKFIEPIFKSLKIKAHYIPYSEFTKYVTHSIKSSTSIQETGQKVEEGIEVKNGYTNGYKNGYTNGYTNGHETSNNGHANSHETSNNGHANGHETSNNGHDTSNNNGNTSSNGQYQNPELLIAWVRVYTKLCLYIVITYVTAVFVPQTTGMFL